jgi:predicted DNA-binding transcriptional regulator YafY
VEAFARLIELLGALQSGPTRTGEELADRLGATLRTMRRNIERLRDAGYQIDAAPQSL